MSLGDAYTLGVKLSLDINELRRELAESTSLVRQFASSSSEAMTNAASAMNRASDAMEASTSRTSRSTRRQSQQTQQDTRRTADGFEEYMRRSTKAQREVADTSESASSRTSTALSSVRGALLRLTGYAGFALLAKQVWDTGIGFHEFSQNAETSFTVLLGSERAAKSMLASVLELAKQTPYAFPDLTQQAQQMLSYGFAAEDIIPTLRAAGDAATGMSRGMAGVERITRALGQVHAKGRLQSEELLQLSEVGVNGLRILANQAGITTGEYQKLVEQGMIPAETAINGLVSGLRDGTDGINGQTKAFGGMMAQIKGAGGITATMDSAKSSFRNASAALTTSLLPAYISLLQTATSGLGVIKSTADLFNLLPRPVRDTALAFGAAVLAMKLLNGEARLKGLWTGMATAWRAAGVEARAAATHTGLLGAAMTTAGTSARALKGSLQSAVIANPISFAVAAATAAFAAYSSMAAEAKARTDAYSEAVTLLGDEAEIAAQKVAVASFTDGADDWGWFQRQRTGYASVADAIEGVGLSVAGAADAVAGSEAEFDAYLDMLKELRSGVGDMGSKEWRTYTEIIAKVEQQHEAYKRAAHEHRQMTDATEEGTEATNVAAAAWDNATRGLRQCSEEEGKVIEAAGDAAEKALDSASRLMSMGLGLTTAKDVEAALRGVEEANRAVRDAEESRINTRNREGASALDIVRSEERVEEAYRRQAEAVENLADVEARRDPVEQYRIQGREMIEAARQFKADVLALADQGLNAQSLLELLMAGPEGSADTRQALLLDPSLILETNEWEKELGDIGDVLSTVAEVAQSSIMAGGEEIAGYMSLGIRAQLEADAHDTIASLAEALGASEYDIVQVGKLLGLSFIQAFLGELNMPQILTRQGRDAWLSNPFRNSNAPGYYTGGTVGVMPGYTPGRDIYTINVSGGEAIMRPEFARAVGKPWVDSMNRISLSGPSAVQAAMSRFAGSFYHGGVVAPPQVVTVPVTSTHEHHDPIHIATVKVNNFADFERQARRRRQDNNEIGA